MDNWFPKIFEDVKCYSPIQGEYIYVSELTSYELDNGINSTRDYQSLLIDPELIEFIKPDEINHTTDSSVHPIYDKDYEYNGRSKVFVSDIEGLNEVKPLVISWESANNISFQLDPYFLLTYGLSPRLTENYVHWDDLRRPKMEIVTSIPKSVYDFPFYSKSFVRIHKEHIQDYIMLRKKALIQVYYETRILPKNKELDELLGEESFFERTTKYNHFRINKISENEIFTEVTGYRVLYFDNSIPISKWDRKAKEHIWPDFDESINRMNAKHLDYVYVSDEVLAKYEQDENYTVYPESGSVSYKNQWSVSRCSRIGRNHIKIELFKLYEGTPNEVISYWNKFSVKKDSIDIEGKNIVVRAKDLVYSYLRFGELLSSALNYSYNTNFTSQDIVGLNRSELNYYGWHNNASISPITHHLSHQLSKQSFLYRQKTLNLFLVENFVEKQLRSIIKLFGIELSKFKKSPNEEFRSIKLLNIILNYFRIAKETGLDIKKDCEEINSRLEQEGELKEIEIIKQLSALNSMRQLDSHKVGSDSDIKLFNALYTFGIDKSELTNNYLTSCELIYEKLKNGFTQASNIINK